MHAIFNSLYFTVKLKFTLINRDKKLLIYLPSIAGGDLLRHSTDTDSEFRKRKFNNPSLKFIQFDF